MIELVLVIAVFVFGLAVGTWLLIRGAKQAIDSHEADTIQALAQHIATQWIFLRVEKDADLLFAYDAVSGDFVCQGTTMENLQANFGLRYPSKKGVLVEPDEGNAHELV